MDNNIERKNAKISNEKRQSLIRLVTNEGKFINDAANILGINVNSARTIMKRFKNTGNIDKKRKGGKECSLLTNSLLIEIEQLISENPEFTLNQLKQKIIAQREEGFQISISTINRGLENLGITMKLSHRELDRVNEIEKIQQRKEYSLWFNNRFGGDFSSVVFVDETSFNLHLRRKFLWSLPGTRLNIRVPTAMGRSVSMILRLTLSGMAHCKVISNTTVNGDIFSNYIVELCTHLKYNLNMQSACIILDNARVHRRIDIERITEEFGFSYKFLSPYSYMLNPIENAFSKIKISVRGKLISNQSLVLS